jgi:hypothetical protein
MWLNYCKDQKKTKVHFDLLVLLVPDFLMVLLVLFVQLIQGMEQS